MCCFSGSVFGVNHTRIFAREVEPGVQGLAYQMEFESKEEVAMILPLPVRLPAWEKAVKFINLEEYEHFFSDLNGLWPVQRSVKSFSPVPAAIKLELEVVQVGSFEASFVPSLADFERLDERFRISPKAWKKLPQYKDYGFAVFQFKAGKQKVHPMALVFESRLEGQLFFPTVHIHDGQVHEKEMFSHTLYAQGWTNGNFKNKDWKPSGQKASAKVSETKAKGLVWGDGEVFRKKLFGKLANRDQILVGKSS